MAKLPSFSGDASVGPGVTLVPVRSQGTVYVEQPREIISADAQHSMVAVFITKNITRVNPCLLSSCSKYRIMYSVCRTGCAGVYVHGHSETVVWFTNPGLLTFNFVVCHNQETPSLR